MKLSFSLCMSTAGKFFRACPLEITLWISQGRDKAGIWAKMGPKITHNSEIGPETGQGYAPVLGFSFSVFSFSYSARMAENFAALG